MSPRPTIVFVVNNDGASDVRVVKTAQVAATHGFTCSVVGCSAALSEPQAFSQHGVDFEILPLRRGAIGAMMAGFFPRLYTAWIARADSDSRPQPKLRSTRESHRQSEALTERSFTGSAQTIYRRMVGDPDNAGSTSRRSVGNVDLHASSEPLARRSRRRTIALMASVFMRIGATARLWFHPRRSVIGVRMMFGTYLRTFYRHLHSKNADVVYAHELWTLEAASWAKSRRRAALLVYDSHELERHRNNDWSFRSNDSRVAYEQRYITASDFIATVCESIAQQLQRQYRVEKPFVVPNAPLSSAHRELPENCKVKARLGLSGQRLIAYTGKVTTGRGLDCLVRLLAEFPQLHLAMVGPTAPVFAAGLVKSAVACGVSDRVHFVARVPPEVLVSFISDADVAVVPIENICLSYYYSLPNKIFEAAMAGLPVLASPLPELSQFIHQHGVGQTVDFSNLQATQLAIQQIMLDPARYNDRDKAAGLQQALSFETMAGPFLKQIAAAAPSVKVRAAQQS